jgi:hypothetical protein
MKHANEDAALTSTEQATLSSLHGGPQVGEKLPVTRELLSWLSGVSGPAPTTAAAKPGAEAPIAGDTLPSQKSDHTGKEEKIEGSLFVKGGGDANEVDINDVRQGALGDCYFMAILASIARVKPDFIKNMVKDNGDGTFTVTFHTHQGVSGLFGSRSNQSVIVDNTFWTDGKGNPQYSKKGDTSSTGSPELWVMVIEKAWAKLNGDYASIEGGKVGGDPWATATGNTPTQLAPGDLSDVELTKKIEDAFTSKQPVIFHSITGDGDAGKKLAKNGVIGNHEYALNAASGGKFTLYNPWGSQHLVDVDAAFIKANFQRVRLLKV